MLLVLQDNPIFHVVRVPILEDIIMVSNRVTHDSVLTVCSYELIKKIIRSQYASLLDRSFDF
jgi:hypothetical protein